ncbi:PD-(D/E)XK nuclease-like domain-containing protein [Isoptericola halotolerans]|uniref:PD-(D/E)XK nuclease-like domain-containing protein n=1 Tax=Isoptericola halotolerans TaxID=300560 RepID=UPI003890E548
MTATTELQGLVRALDERTYHAHEGSLSSTGARTIVQSPKQYRHDQDHPTEPTHAMELGTAVHTELLGVGSPIRYVEASSWQTKAAKEERAEARAAGEAPILEKDRVLVEGMAAAVREHPVAAALLAECTDREVSLFAPDPATGIVRRGRIDAITPLDHPDPKILDLKTAAFGYAAPNAWTWKATDRGYWQQADWYRELIADITGVRAPFLQVVVESAAPHEVSVWQVSNRALDIGGTRNRLALDLLAWCTRTGQWPGRSDGIHLTDDFPLNRYESQTDDLVVAWDARMNPEQP